MDTAMSNGKKNTGILIGGFTLIMAVVLLFSATKVKVPTSSGSKATPTTPVCVTEEALYGSGDLIEKTPTWSELKDLVQQKGIWAYKFTPKGWDTITLLIRSYTSDPIEGALPSYIDERVEVAILNPDKSGFFRTYTLSHWSETSHFNIVVIKDKLSNLLNNVKIGGKKLSEDQLLNIFKRACK